MAVECWGDQFAGSDAVQAVRCDRSQNGRLHGTWASGVWDTAPPGDLFHRRKNQKAYALVTVPRCSAYLARCGPAMFDFCSYYVVVKSDQLSDAQQKGAPHLDQTGFSC